MSPTRATWACVVAIILCTVGSAAQAEDSRGTSQTSAALAKAKSHYNNAQYEEAASIYVNLAQIDPGAVETHGQPYRNLARCMFWLERYDAAVFWYDIYRSGWPDAADADAVFAERKTANARRRSPTDPVPDGAVYDRSVRELVETLRLRLDAGAPAITAEGGGTWRLYQLALDRGYAMPALAGFGKQLRQQLLGEVGARWNRSARGPLPLTGAQSEPAEVSRQRLVALRKLNPSKPESLRIDAYERLVSAWSDASAENYERAAAEFKDAAELLPELDYLPYARALALHRSGQSKEAIEILGTTRESAPKELRPYYALLEAEVRLAAGNHKTAGALYWYALQPAKSAAKK